MINGDIQTGLTLNAHMVWDIHQTAYQPGFRLRSQPVFFKGELPHGIL